MKHLSLILLLALSLPAQAAQAPLPMLSSPPPDAETIAKRIQYLESLKERITNGDAIDGLSGEKIDEALALYGKAEEELRQIAQDTAQTRRYQDLQREAPAQLASMEARLELLRQPEESVFPPTLTADKCQELLDQARQDLQRSSEALETTRKTDAAWKQRRKEIPSLIRSAKEQQDSIQERHKALSVSQEPPAFVQALSELLHCQWAAATAGLENLQAEQASYEARDELLKSQLDVHAAEVRRDGQKVDMLQTLVEKLRSDEVKRQQQEAERALENAADVHPVVLKLAKENLELAERRATLVEKLQSVERRIKAKTERREKLTRAHESILEKITAAGKTNAIGLLMRKSRAELSSQQPPEEAAIELDSISSIQLQLIELREQRSAQLGRDEQIQQLMEDPSIKELEGSLARMAIQGRIGDLIDQKNQTLEALHNDMGEYFNKLVTLDSARRELSAQIKAFAAFIDEHVLWIRSAQSIHTTPLIRYKDAIFWLVSRAHWTKLGEAVWANMRTVPSAYLAALLIFAAALVARLFSHRRLEALASQPAEVRMDSFVHTARALAYTILASMAGPVGLGLLSWRIGAAAGDDEFARAIATALAQTAWIFFSLELFRKICRKRCIAEVHFRWPVPVLQAARRIIHLWLLVVLPMLFVVIVLETQANELHKASLERFIFIAAMLMTCGFACRLLRRDGPVSLALEDSDAAMLQKTRWIWFPAFVAGPLLLAVASAVGYGYMATELFWRLLATLILMLYLATIKAMALRWLLLLRRQVAKEHIQKQREDALEKQRREGAGETEEAEAELAFAAEMQEEAPLSLADLRQQTNTLVQWFIAASAAAGLYIIWVNILPALGFLNRVNLWSVTAAAGGVVNITLGHVLLGVVTAILTTIAARNLPGVLEFTLLQRLPLDAGARYAAKTIIRYILSVVGLLIITSLIGLKWSSVQWLVAALGVGLGFGLQEIFANFVSGLILLFERPVRVGDTVTIGDVIGTVTRIRIRATTITDWDRKELIVPNREFITGRLINWTLSDDIVRIRVPVGIAYGSDTDLAHKTLLRVAQEIPEVLDSPPPCVRFESFGDNSLNFEVRAFVKGLNDFLSIRSELHMRIDQAFREANITIAFPQRDVHFNPLKPLDVRVLTGKEDGPPTD